MKKKVFILEEHLDDEYKINIENYTHVRAYHACRPLNISDYLQEGIKPIDYRMALQDVKIRIVSDFVSEREATRMFRTLWKDSNDIHKKVWVQLNKEDLLTFSGHYLIYGSEFINTLAMNLGCRDRLKNIGIPTIFSCDIPIEDINFQTISDIEQCFYNKHTDDIGFSVWEIVPEDIVDYEHPVKGIPDPYYGRIKYIPDYKMLTKLGFISDKLS